MEEKSTVEEEQDPVLLNPIYPGLFEHIRYQVSWGSVGLGFQFFLELTYQ